jgi:CBS domain-containing protein
MNVSDYMTRDVTVVGPNDTLQQAAKIMGQLDCGCLPVGENDRLVGMITDRDIATRAVAEGLGPDTKGRGIMSSELRWCYDDDDVEDVADQMAEYKVRRLPVINRDKRLVGMISLGDISQADGALSSHALKEISEPGGIHSQH